MSRTQGNVAALSRFVFRAPDWSASLFFTLLVAAIVGVAAFDSGFFLNDAYFGMVYVAVPTLVAAFGTAPLDRRLGGRFTYNRSALLAFLCELLVVVFLVAAATVAALFGLGQPFVFDVLLVALASVFALRLFVIVAVSRRSIAVAALPASIQTIVTAGFLLAYNGAIRYWILLVLCAVYTAAVYFFLYAIDRPWKGNLGVSVLDFVRGFIGHVAEGSRELETFFETLGEKAVVPVTVLAVRRPDGAEKARFVLPMIHPGPMGEIGGGNLPERIAATTDSLAFPPHATAGHDFNLVTEREVEPLLDAASKAADRITYDRTASKSDRESEGDGTFLGQAIGDDLLLVGTHAPEPADDVAFSVGLSVAAEARAAGAEGVMLVDAHNCNDGLSSERSGRIGPGSQRSFDMMEGAGRLAGRLSTAPQKALSVGIAHDGTEWDAADGIGPLGIRVAVFEVGGQRTAYVLIDGNNMEPGLRERLIDAIGTDNAEIMTTDTHIVNTVEAANQVGGAIEGDRLVSSVETLVGEAIADLDPVEAGIETTRAEVTVFGNDRTESLAATANAMVGMGGALLAAIVGTATAVSLLVFVLTG
jgi:putative membrane protein